MAAQPQAGRYKMHLPGGRPGRLAERACHGSKQPPIVTISDVFGSPMVRICMAGRMRHDCEIHAKSVSQRFRKAFAMISHMCKISSKSLRNPRGVKMAAKSLRDPCEILAIANLSKSTSTSLFFHN